MIKLSDYSNDAVRNAGQVMLMERSESFQVGGYANQVLSFTVTAVDDNVASFKVTDEAGNVYSFSVTGSLADTAADIRDALLTVVQADKSFGIIATAEAAATSDIKLTVAQKGRVLAVSSLVGAGSLSEDTDPTFGSPIPAGRVVVRNSADSQVMELPSSGSVSADLLGVVIRKHAYSVADNNDDLQIPVACHGEVMYRGEILVEVDSNVSAGGAVYVRVNNGKLGIARADADGGDAVLLDSARFIKDCVAGDYAQIRINKP